MRARLSGIFLHDYDAMLKSAAVWPVRLASRSLKTV